MLEDHTSLKSKVKKDQQYWAISDFLRVLSIGDPQEGRGYVAILPTCGPSLVCSQSLRVGLLPSVGCIVHTPKIPIFKFACSLVQKLLVIFLLTISMLGVYRRHHIPLATNPHTGTGVISDLNNYNTVGVLWNGCGVNRRVGGKGWGWQGKIIDQHIAGGGKRVNFLNTRKS